MISGQLYPLAFSELVNYIIHSKVNTETLPVIFRLADLASLYKHRLQQLGVGSQDINITRLKEQLLYFITVTLPPQERKATSQVQSKTKNMKQQRRQETPEERNRRLETLRERAATSRASETEQQREARLQEMRDRATTSKASQAVQQRETRLQEMRDRATTSKASQAVQQRETRLQEMRDRATTSKASGCRLYNSVRPDYRK
ncbi:zinc finger protein 821-like [Macrobrachium rosenbergii]|uniref:zinc finger protein 821-like n=1 Tax=Macrobrachium rosenbergii TaxID=79674 RepID=UPI0034D6E471